MVRPPSRHPRGFTLIEASLAIVIVGTGCVAAMMLFEAVSKQNRLAQRLTTAAQLARHVEEATTHLPYDDPITRDATFGPEAGETLATFNDLDDFSAFDTLGGPPVDALRTPIPELAQFSQIVEVVRVDGNTLQEPGTGAVRVDVSVRWSRDGGEPRTTVATTSWYRTP